MMISSYFPAVTWRISHVCLGFIYTQLVGWTSDSFNVISWFFSKLRGWHLWCLRCFHRCANISHLRTHLGRNTCVIVLGDVRSHVCRFLSCEFQRFLGLKSILMLSSHFRKSKKMKNVSKKYSKIPPAVWQMAVLQLVQANAFDSVQPAVKVPPQGQWNFRFENQVSAANELSSALQIAEPAPKVVEK